MFAQSGSIKGTIRDAATNEGIIGANVILEGTTTGASTDVNGNYVIPKVPTGTVNLVISYISYRTKKVEGVRIEENKTTTINTNLEEDVAMLQDIVVVGAREAHTDIAVINEIKNATQVVSGVSSEQITRSMDRDAAQVMMRVPGITIQDNRFISIRGVSERYNQVMINNAIAPSTEIDVRSFSFDLIPSNMIERMLVYKSGTADLPGDFAGGVIKLFTQSSVNENFTNISLSGGFRVGTTLNDFQQSKTSSTDFLGFDNGFRKLPSDFPANLNDVSGENAFDVVRSLPNNFSPIRSTAAPDFSFGVGFGRKFFIGKVDVSNLTSINYSYGSQYMNIDRNLYLQYNSQTGTVGSPIFQYNDDFYERSNRVGIIHNWRFVLNPNTTIEFKNLYNQIGDHETVLRNGQNLVQRSSDELQNYGYRYTERRIYSGQLLGTHKFGGDRSTLSWLVGTNYLLRNEPDFRRFRTFRTAGTDNGYEIITPSQSSLVDNSRFYSNLDEYSISNGVDFERKLGKTDAKNPLVYKLGYYVDYRDRSFAARYFSYNIRNPRQELTLLPIDQFFAPENIGRGDVEATEGTNLSDSYKGTNLLTAGYASISIPFGRFYLSTGARVEHNRQQLESRDNANRRLNVDNPIFVPMPFANLSFDLSERSLMRLAYSRTVNRPEFRELAPFLYYDFVNEANVVGSPDLETARIHNIDLRYEFYPRPGETISIAGFYKNFDKPIENYVTQASDGTQQFSYRNAVLANNVGVELEVRKSLSDIAGESFLKNLSLVFNGSYIYSRVDLGSDPTLIQDRIRALQGQSPYIANLAAFYDDRDRGFAFNVFYNVFGKRISRVGSDIFPTVYEMPRNMLDATISKTIGEKVTLKVGAQNILNARYRFFQDSNRNREIGGVDQLITGYQRGAYYTAGVAIKL
ncbi:TonB-dependent receptor [Rhodocytophaga aerolata]|uniref:TonB-dependent receptor n=1 Tax=Rhodocytophaga aerolata TaxID=455078 RepID=UPI003670D8EF